MQYTSMQYRCNISIIDAMYRYMYCYTYSSKGTLDRISYVVKPYHATEHLHAFYLFQ